MQPLENAVIAEATKLGEDLPEFFRGCMALNDTVVTEYPSLWCIYIKFWHVQISPLPQCCFPLGPSSGYMRRVDNYWALRLGHGGQALDLIRPQPSLRPVQWEVIRQYYSLRSLGGCKGWIELCRRKMQVCINKGPPFQGIECGGDHRLRGPSRQCEKCAVWYQERFLHPFRSLGSN